MAETALQTRSTGFRIGWWILTGISALGVLGHAGLAITIPEEAVLFTGWTAFPLYSLGVLLFPYRKGERWAWYLTWTLVLAFALVFFFDSEIGSMYLSLAGLAALGQFLTRSAFFSGN